MPPAGRQQEQAYAGAAASSACACRSCQHVSICAAVTGGTSQEKYSTFLTLPSPFLLLVFKLCKFKIHKHVYTALALSPDSPPREGVGVLNLGSPDRVSHHIFFFSAAHVDAAIKYPKGSQGSKKRKPLIQGFASLSLERTRSYDENALPQAIPLVTVVGPPPTQQQQPQMASLTDLMDMEEEVSLSPNGAMANLHHRSGDLLEAAGGRAEVFGRVSPGALSSHSQDSQVSQEGRTYCVVRTDSSKWSMHLDRRL